MQSNKTKRAFSLLEISIVILVIGVAIAAIVKGSDVYEEYKLSSARNLTNSSVVNYVDGLTVWFDATSTSSFAKEDMSDGDKIASWKSISTQSSEDFEVTRTGSDSVKPTYNIDGINGLPAVYFDGGDYLSKQIMTRDIVDSNQATAFFVVNSATTYSDATVFSFDVPRFSVHQSLGAIKYDFVTYNSGRTTYYGSMNEPVIISLKTGNSYSYIRLNGKDVASKNIGGLTIGSFSRTFYIGSLVGSYRYRGDIGELIIFNRALDDEEVADIEKYLSTKWKISLAD